MQQKKNIFLHSEADAWFERNQHSVANKNFATDDPVTDAIAEIACLSQYAERAVN